MHDLFEEQWVRLPLRERVSEQVDNRRTDVERVEVRVDRRDVEGQRHVLDELPVAALEGVAPQPVARLGGGVGEQADGRHRRQGCDQMARCDAGGKSRQNRSEMRGDEASGAEQAQAHRLTIGIRDGRAYPCGVEVPPKNGGVSGCAG